MEDKLVCAKCKMDISDGCGNNPSPLLKSGRVCDECHDSIIWLRILQCHLPDKPKWQLLEDSHNMEIKNRYRMNKTQLIHAMIEYEKSLI